MSFLDDVVRALSYTPGGGVAGTAAGAAVRHKGGVLGAAKDYAKSGTGFGVLGTAASLAGSKENRGRAGKLIKEAHKQGVGSGVVGSASALAAAAKRRTEGKNKPSGNKAQSTTLDQRRAERMKHKTFHGKYYGPDEFKGDMRMLKAYRSSGSPKDQSKFAADYQKVTGQKAKTGWNNTQNRGQGASVAQGAQKSTSKKTRVFRDGKWVTSGS